MSKEKRIFKCTACGAEFPRWAGKCEKCGEWNTISEEAIIKSTNNNINKHISKTGIRLKDVSCNENIRINTGIIEFDRVVGGGLVNDSLTILSAPPGIGKSTLCIMIANEMIKQGYNVLYASGEESASQIKNRAVRLQLDSIDDLVVADTTNLDFVINEIENYNIDFIVLDSIQTFYLNNFLPSRAGNPTQVIECANALREICKRADRPRSAIIIGQMTKEDELAGTRGLEHLVDTYIKIEGDSDDTIRSLHVIKNRFGSTGEVGYFNMTEKGLISIDNPSEFFMTERDAEDEVVGSSLTTLKDGNRILVCEIESLVSKSFTSFPTRISESMKRDKLNILTSILEQRGGIVLTDQNVAVKTFGGVKLDDPGCNLAIIMSIASSRLNQPIPNGTVFCGDVGLTGEIKKIPSLEIRIKELERMGYKNIYISANETKDFKTNSINVIRCKTLSDVIKNVFANI
jgi:DNA repair protein RadA/Sms